jgi:hypothetical protein
MLPAIASPSDDEVSQPRPARLETYGVHMLRIALRCSAPTPIRKEITEGRPLVLPPQGLRPY